MKLTAQLKLLPTPEQADALKRTLEAANAACNYISDIAFSSSTFGKFALQKLCYRDVRETFGLAAQMTIRALAKVGDAYKLDKETKRMFRPLASIAYDDRLLSFALPDSSISIWTLNGRQPIPFVCGPRQRAMLATRQGESDLLFHRGNFYLLVTCQVEEIDPQAVDDVLGIDLGVTNIATDSDGEIHSGKTIKHVRYRHRRLRNKLQKLGTLGSRRRLRTLSGPEKRFAKHVNHCLSKRIVAKAERTKRAIALEDLTHIRTRARARRSQRATLHSWAFAQLRAFVTYKARLLGVSIHFVDPGIPLVPVLPAGIAPKRTAKPRLLLSAHSAASLGQQM
jgi:IS605 OrfB family transposase